MARTSAVLTRWRLRRDPQIPQWTWLLVETTDREPPLGMTARVFDRPDAREWLPKLRTALEARIALADSAPRTFSPVDEVISGEQE